jgi:tryptophan-rich sensory protein
MTFIDNGIDAAIFLVLTHILFHDYFSSSGSQYVMTKYYKTFFAEYQRRMWLPPRLLFPIVWTILFILIEVAMMAFHLEVVYGDWLAPVIYVLFAVNIMANKQWSPIFIIQKRFIWSLMLILFILVTGITMLVLFAINNLWLSFCTFLPYMLWCLFALYLNAMVIYVTDTKESSC